MNSCIKRTMIATFAMTIGASAFAVGDVNTRSQVYLPMSQRDVTTTVGRDEATKEWLKSWHKDEVYMTVSEYLFEARLEVEKNKDASGGETIRWLKGWIADKVTDFASVVEKGRFNGKALAKTFVYHETPKLRLIRDYQYVMGNGVWGGNVIPNNEIVQKVLANVASADAMGRQYRHLFYTGVSFINPVVGDFLATWGEAGYEIAADWASSNIGPLDSEGRIVISENSLIGKAFGADERKKVMAMAMQFSKDVNGRKIAIASNGKYSRELREIKSIKSDTVDPRASVDSFDEYLRQGDVANDNLKALIKRETFSVTSDLFDAEARKPGDVWVVDGAFFNSFLHPDLKGAFRGRAVVKYVRDEEGEDAYISVPAQALGKEKAYDVRKIEVLPYGKVDGATVSTDLTYDERVVGGRFWAKYDSNKSDIYILVDKASGHVVNGRLSLIADEVGALPSLPLLDGFKSAGQASLDLTIRGEIANLNDYKR